jgi:tRNA(Ile2) C34 agmatinyltransferase TiaS
VSPIRQRLCQGCGVRILSAGYTCDPCRSESREKQERLQEDERSARKRGLTVMTKTRDGYRCTACGAIYDLLVVLDPAPRTLCRTCYGERP